MCDQNLPPRSRSATSMTTSPMAPIPCGAASWSVMPPALSPWQMVRTAPAASHPLDDRRRKLGGLHFGRPLHQPGEVVGDDLVVFGRSGQDLLEERIGDDIFDQQHVARIAT